MTPTILATTAITVLLLDPIPPEPLKSGPPVGAKNNRGGFFPNLVAGPGAGERRCPV